MNSVALPFLTCVLCGWLEMPRGRENLRKAGLGGLRCIVAVDLAYTTNA